MTSVQEDIKKAREIIASSKKKFIGFNTDTFIYRFTNESIELYKNYLMNRKKVLSVTASGDQILNSILFGSKEIDSFDISRFPKYYFELKKAAIETLTRDEFIDFFVGKHLSSLVGFISCYKGLENDKLKEYYSGFNNNMDKDYKEFWDEIFDIYDINQVFSSPMFLVDDCHFQALNPYLYDNNYEKLQKNIKNAKVKHYIGDIRQISSMLNKEYDLVNLSNIINYIDSDEYKDILNNLSLSDDGIALSYIPVLEKYIKNYFYQEEYQFNNLDKEFPEAVMIYQKRK